MSLPFLIPAEPNLAPEPSFIGFYFPILYQKVQNELVDELIDIKSW